MWSYYGGTRGTVWRLKTAQYPLFNLSSSQWSWIHFRCVQDSFVVIQLYTKQQKEIQTHLAQDTTSSYKNKPIYVQIYIHKIYGCMHTWKRWTFSNHASNHTPCAHTHTHTQPCIHMFLTTLIHTHPSPTNSHTLIHTGPLCTISNIHSSCNVWIPCHRWKM